MYDLVKLLFVSSLLGFMYYYVTKNVSGIYIAVLLVILAVSVIFYSALSRVKQFSRAQIEQIDEMSGEQFEDYTKFLLNKLGYSNVKVTPNVGDQGIDVIAHKDGIKHGFQCKRWKKNVGNKAVQEVHAGIGFYSLDKGFVITNSNFTNSAKQLAEKLDIELWNRDRLIQLLEQIKKEEIKEEKSS
ncbi:restriction endonuclease [Enterococcus eurekensis]|uniref:Restriction endonuclease n=2 Tax=Enterococcus TaxID=1350 RepID=A0ABV9M461_9ENTE|nr:restriction endonuclease [Candidatus Enterococcus avicola]